MKQLRCDKQLKASMSEQPYMLWTYKNPAPKIKHLVNILDNN